MKVLWVQMIKSDESELIPPAFFALVFENELEYHYLYVRINRAMIRLRLI